MANAASIRNLVAGSGTVSITVGTKLLTFSAAQSFKEGTTIVVEPAGAAQCYTIDTGAGTTWTTMQLCPATLSAKPYNVSDSGTGRNRGSGPIVPDAVHFVYRAVLDNSGNQDYYQYVDTPFPEKGLHPYTRDQYSGISLSSAKAQQAFINDLASRVRELEGLLRYNGGTNDGHILLPDQRLRRLETQVFGSALTPTKQQALDLGDA